MKISLEINEKGEVCRITNQNIINVDLPEYIVNGHYFGVVDAIKDMGFEIYMGIDKPIIKEYYKNNKPLDKNDILELLKIKKFNDEFRF